MLCASSCDNFDLDLQEDPNFPAVSAGDIDALYNNIQLEFAAIHFTLEDQTGEVTRMYNATSNNYGAATLPSVFDGLWQNVYADFLPDIALLEELGGTGFPVHVGTAKILQAYVLMEMVDVFGDIPLTEIGQGLEELSPQLNDGADVYAAADDLLDEAIVLLNDAGDIEPAFDNFYDSDVEKWITLANTIKLRAAYLTGDASAFNSIITAGDFIDEEDEDFQYNYGTGRNLPESRHPRYINQYEQADGDYMSNYYMWLLRADKLETDGTTEIRDPRLRYYFNRKVNSSDRQPTDSYGCVLSGLPDQTAKPSSWDAIDPRLPYCYAATDGYTGRDHLNGSGIPADGAIRTAYGLYPMAGSFDGNEFENTQNLGADGGQGVGILPLILSSFVDFMRADMTFTGGAGDARALMISGVGKSLAKVRGFESLVSNDLNESITVGGITTTKGAAFAMTDTDVSDYEATVGRLYDEATSDAERRDVVVKEYYIAAYGNGLEAYNMYRKTGYPANMQPRLQAGTAEDLFPRSMRYANAFVDRNIDVEQKLESELVFWDPGTSDVR